MIKKYLVLSLLLSQSMILRSMFTRMPNPGRLSDKDQVEFASMARNYESRKKADEFSKRAVAISVVNRTPVGQDPQLDALNTMVNSKKATYDLHRVLDYYRGKNLVDKVKHCINKGANVNSENHRDLSPLAALMAFRSQSAQESRNSVDFGSDPDPDYAQKSEIERHNRVDIARALLQAGANPNGLSGCQSGSSLLSRSYSLWLTEFAETLLEYGADPNEKLRDNTPLFLDVLSPSFIDLANAFIDTGKLYQDVKDRAIKKLESQKWLEWLGNHAAKLNILNRLQWGDNPGFK